MKFGAVTTYQCFSRGVFDLSGLMMFMVKASASVASTCQIQSLVLHKQKQNSIILNTAGQSDLTLRLMTLGIKQ